MRTKTKEFTKYFFGTFKQGKFLLLKYLGMAGLMVVVAVLSNLLEVYELTYLNAFLAINYFSSMLSFGISQSTNTFVNQNYNFKHKVRRFAQMGFQMNFAIILLFTIALVSFPKFFMESIAEFIPNDYTFFYIMCGYFFITGIQSFAIEILKQLQRYKAQMLCECIPIAITVVGFLVLYFAGVYLLNLIAIVYILSGTIGLVMAIILLSKDKKMSINLFGRTTIKFTKQQWVIIINTFISEILWEIGYYATTIFLLRMNDGMFNTYSYLENVLDIINGVFFTYVNVISIKITRSLGRKKFDKAYMHAKYSIYGSVVIWLGYFVLSMGLSYPLALGANNAYFEMMFYVIPLYTGIHLARFLFWNFSSYMLQLGGFTKPFVIMDALGSIYLVAICFIADLLPVNLILAYSLIIVPDLLSLPFCFWIFKSKKWMTDINDDPSLLKNQIKCFIFDFDDTLYYGEKNYYWHKLLYKWFDEHFKDISSKDKKIILKNYGCIKRGKVKITDEKLSRILNDIEGTCRPYINFRNRQLVIFPEDKKGFAVKKSVLNKCGKQGKMYIVSNSRRKYVNTFSKLYNIDLGQFDGILVNEFEREKESKKYLYEKIMRQNNLAPNEIIVVGDNYKEDLLPAKQLGMHFYRCKNGFTYEEIIG